MTAPRPRLQRDSACIPIDEMNVMFILADERPNLRIGLDSR